MKRQIIIQPLKSHLSFVARIILFACLVIPAASVIAQDSGNPSQDVAIKYAGMLKGKSVFRVQYANQDTASGELLITDENGELYFSEKFRKQNFTKYFLVDADQTDSFKLVITLASSHGKNRTVYLVSGRVTSSDDFLVTKL